MTKEETLALINEVLTGAGTKLSGWAAKEGLWDKAVEQGITDGTRPGGVATREEVVSIIMRAKGE